ncbi:uncharacterized protein LOC118749364 isoform X1 [Rhagoletis pomonella]|uniref:uncharacterized protein LOC118749364 isoform X1 n=1 Tax=Rhagoletis pomonella TaxID=28610 RepID=UPI00178064EC|nr:uncharacterized protein LOC118749364 isoform X1 [Rhagoletis pomonella]
MLSNVNMQSTGRFRCEVSGEAPSFQTVTEHGDMVVVSLPDQGPPKISGCRPRYTTGDWVRINCTNGRSKPAVELYWYVNGEPAESHALRKYDTIISGRDGLETTILGLQFRVEQHHFQNGDMKLKCIAALSNLYWRSNEESVEGDRSQKAPALDSHETAYASNSRADPVQGMSLREIFVTKILSFFIQPNAASKTDSHLVAHAPSMLLLLLVAVAVASGYPEQLHMWQQLSTPTQWLHENFKQRRRIFKQYQQHKKLQQSIEKRIASCKSYYVNRSSRWHLKEINEIVEQQFKGAHELTFFLFICGNSSSVDYNNSIRLGDICHHCRRSFPTSHFRKY